MMPLYFPPSRIDRIDPVMLDTNYGRFDPFKYNRNCPFETMGVPRSNFAFQPIPIKNQQCRISFDLGFCYKDNEIKIDRDEDTLKVSGRAVEYVKNGSNTHQFEREIQIPDDVEASTMRYELNLDILYIIFDLKHTEPKKIFKDFSNDQEFRVSMNFDGIKRQDLCVKVVGNNLIVDCITRSSDFSFHDGYETITYVYDTWTIKMPESVELDKLRAMLSNGSLKIFAPKDPSKIEQTDRSLHIET